MDSIVEMTVTQQILILALFIGAPLGVFGWVAGYSKARRFWKGIVEELKTDIGSLTDELLSYRGSGLLTTYEKEKNDFGMRRENRTLRIRVNDLKRALAREVDKNDKLRNELVVETAKITNITPFPEAPKFMDHTRRGIIFDEYLDKDGEPCDAPDPEEGK